MTLDPETLVAQLHDDLTERLSRESVVVVSVPDSQSILILQTDGEHLLVTVNRAEVVPS